MIKDGKYRTKVFGFVSKKQLAERMERIEKSGGFLRTCGAGERIGAIKSAEFYSNYFALIVGEPVARNSTQQLCFKLQRRLVRVTLEKFY